MKKLTLFITILLLAGIVLIGGSCGGEDGDTDLGDINLDKELSESEIRYVLNKTAQDLGWVGFEISGKQGWYTLQVKSGALVRRGISINESSWLPMIIAGSTKENFVEKVCAQTENISYDFAGSKAEIIKISGFDACHTREYLEAFPEDCSEDDFVHIVIGNYLLWAMTHDMKEGRGVVCVKEDAMPIAETLVNNFLEALK